MDSEFECSVFEPPLYYIMQVSKRQQENIGKLEREVGTKSPLLVNDSPHP